MFLNEWSHLLNILPKEWSITHESEINLKKWYKAKSFHSALRLLTYIASELRKDSKAGGDVLLFTRTFIRNFQTVPLSKNLIKQYGVNKVIYVFTALSSINYVYF